MLVTPSTRPRRQSGIRTSVSDIGTLVFASEAAITNLKWRHLITASRRVIAGIQEESGGHTTWYAAVGNDTHAAITWEWAVINGGSIAFADILAVESNLYPTNLDGSTMSPSKRRIVLTSILNGTGWEDAVRKYIRAYQ